MSNFPSGKLQDFFKFYDPSRPQHVQAVRDLEGHLRKVAPKLLTDEADWVKNWRKKPAPVANSGQGKPMDVIYLPQYDSSLPGQAARTCQSSCVAATACHLKPSLFPPGIKQPDDWYIANVLRKFGDTTDMHAHVRALHSMGFKAQFRTDGDWDTLEQLLDAGSPVPIGILHHGLPASPTGGGHYILAVGYDEKNIYVNDPAGNLDLAGSGGYSAGWGKPTKGVGYSRANLGPRWMVGGTGGWFHQISI